MATNQTNDEVLEKITTTGSFSDGGTLSPERFNAFFSEVQNESTILDVARTISVTAPSGDIPMLGVGERLARPVNEAEAPSLSDIQQPSVPYQTTKVALARQFSWEAINETISDPERAVAQMFITLMANDLERYVSVGDTSSSDSFEMAVDGWLTLAQNSSNVQTYDHKEDNTSDSTDNPTAQPIDKTLFGNMKMAMPRRYRDKDNLGFLVSSDQLLAYKQWLTERNTAAGDQMLMTQEQPSAYGVPIYTPLEWPDSTAMLADMDALSVVLQGNKMRVEHAEKGKEMTLKDIASVTNIISMLDYVILEEESVVLGEGIEAPSA